MERRHPTSRSGVSLQARGRRLLQLVDAHVHSARHDGPTLRGGSGLRDGRLLLVSWYGRRLDVRDASRGWGLLYELLLDLDGSLPNDFVLRLVFADMQAPARIWSGVHARPTMLESHVHERFVRRVRRFGADGSLRSMT